MALSHAQDQVPAEFDKVTTIENGQVTTDNLLYESQTIEIPGTYSVNDVGLGSYTIDAIKVVPSDGTYWINNPNSASVSSKDMDGYYLYFDSNDDSVFETVFVMDKCDSVVGIGFDYAQDSKFEPGATVKTEKAILWSKAYNDQYVSDDYIHFRETDKEVGVFKEPTFSDVLFDIHSMEFSQGASELILEAERVADDLFEEQVVSNMGTDLLVQTLAAVVGTLLGAAVFEKSGGTASAFAFMLGYLAVIYPYQCLKISEQENYYAHRTFRLAGSSDKTLGQMFWFDDMYANIMPITLFGSIGGVYSPVYGGTDKRSYSADLIVRGYDFFGSKASTLGGTSYMYPKLDYWLSTRNIMGYSYFGGGEGSAVYEFLQSKNIINPAIDIGIPEYNHAYSSVYFLERQLQADIFKNSDTINLDTIVPSMEYDYANGRFTPRYAFVDSMSFASPEFYTEYPVFVAEDSSAVNQYVSIYKEFALENFQQTFTVFEPNCRLKVDVVSIDIYIVWLRETQMLTDARGIYFSEHSFVLTLTADQFEVNMTTGEITIASDQIFYSLVNSLIDQTSSNEERSEEDSLWDYSEPTLLFQIKVEKYRSITDLRDNMTAEQANTIATAQAVEAAILEYNYQYNLAMQTRLSYAEICYTLTVTAISTALSMLASYGIGQWLSGFVPLTNMESAIFNPLGDTAGKAAASHLEGIISRLTISGTQVLWTVVREMAQEVLIDPWFEAAVSGVTRRWGWNAYIQATLSTLAESGREALSGITSYRHSADTQTQLTQILDAKRSGRVSTQLEVIGTAQQIVAGIQSQQAQAQAATASLRTMFKALSFVTKAIGFTASMLMGPVAELAYSTVAAVCFTEEISLKGLFKKVLDSLTTSNVDPSTPTENLKGGKVPIAKIIEELEESNYKLARLTRAATSGTGVRLYDNTKFEDITGYSVARRKISAENPDSIVAEKLLDYSKKFVASIKSEYQNARAEIKAKSPIQTTITGDRGVVIRMGDLNFAKVLENRAKLGFFYKIYRWQWKGVKTSISHEGVTRFLGELPYFGWTEGFDIRVKEQVIDEALTKYARGLGLTLHQQAVIKALKLEKENIIRKINSIDRDADIDPKMSDLPAIYHWYRSKVGTGLDKQLETYLVSKKVIRKYFNIKIIELHGSERVSLDSERELTLKFKHSVDGNLVEGTIWPNGLNMVPGGAGYHTGAKRVVMENFLDIIALASLGFKEGTIAEIMSKVYGIHVSQTTLSKVIVDSEFGSFLGLQEVALKPVVRELIWDTSISYSDIYNLLPFSVKTLYHRLTEWFGGGYRALKFPTKAIKASDLDLKQIKMFKSEFYDDIFRESNPEEVIEVLLKSKAPNKDLAALLNMRRMDSVSMYKISRFFTGTDMNPTELQRYLHKEESKALLQQGVAPEVILEDHFDLRVWRTDRGKTIIKKNRVEHLFEDFFKDSHLSFEEIIRAYHCNPKNILAIYMMRNPILKE